MAQLISAANLCLEAVDCATNLNFKMQNPGCIAMATSSKDHYFKANQHRSLHIFLELIYFVYWLSS